MERRVGGLMQAKEDRERQDEESARKVQEEQTKKIEEQKQLETTQERQKAEQDFLKLSVEQAEKNPVLAKLAREKPMGALAMAYTAYHDFKATEDREPMMAELVATAEKILSGEEKNVGATVVPIDIPVEAMVRAKPRTVKVAPEKASDG